MCDWVYMNGHMTATLGRHKNHLKIDLNQNFEIPRVRAVRDKTREDKTFAKILETPRKKRQVSESEAEEGSQGKVLRGLQHREVSEPSLSAAERFLSPSFVHSFKATLPFPRPKIKPHQQVKH